MLSPLAAAGNSTLIPNRDADLSGKKLEPQQADNSNRNQQSPGATSPNHEDSLELSRDGLALGEPRNSSASTAVINDYQEAKNLVSRIRQQFEETGPQALAAQSKLLPDRVSRLLTAAS